MIIFVLCVILDQITKILALNIKNEILLIPNLLSFDYVENRGAVFGMMQGSNYILALISIVICIAILIYFLKQKKDNKKINVAWYLILAGGIGNIIDRLARGYVIDFIKTPFIATFNLADSFVVIGVGILIINELILYYKDKTKNKTENES